MKGEREPEYGLPDATTPQVPRTQTLTRFIMNRDVFMKELISLTMRAALAPHGVPGEQVDEMVTRAFGKGRAGWDAFVARNIIAVLDSTEIPLPQSSEQPNP